MTPHRALRSTAPYRAGGPLISVVVALCALTAVGVPTAFAGVGHVTLFSAKASAVTAGPGRNVWFASGGAIGRITHKGVVTRFPLHQGMAATFGITTGPDGNLWFPEFSNSGEFIGRMSPSGAVKDFPVPDGTRAENIAPGGDGNVWFTAHDRLIGRITPAGAVRLFRLRTQHAYVEALTDGPDGNVWFTERHPAQIGRITPAGDVTEFGLPADMQTHNLNGITAGRDGLVWFTDAHGNGLIMAMNTNGAVVRTIRPKGTPNPAGITVGADGTLWFAAHNGIDVGHLKADGTVAAYHVIDDSNVLRDTIALGGDGDLWLPAGEPYPRYIARVAGG